MTTPLQRVVVLVLVIAVAVVMPSTLLPVSTRASTVAGFSVVLFLASAWLWWSVVFVVWRARHAGAALLDLGRPWRDHMAHSVGALLSSGLALWALLTPYLSLRVLALGYLSVAAYALLQSLSPLFGRVQVRVGGIDLPTEYIPWPRIGAYSLRTAGRYTWITVRYRAWALTPGFPLEMTLRCRADQRKGLEAILAEYVVERGAHRSSLPG